MDVTSTSAALAGDGDEAGLGALLGRELFFASDSAAPSFDDAVLGGGEPVDGDEGDAGVTADDDDDDDDRAWRDDRAPAGTKLSSAPAAASQSPPKRAAAGDATAALIEADLTSAAAALSRRLRSTGGTSWGGAYGLSCGPCRGVATIASELSAGDSRLTQRSSHPRTVPPTPLCS